MIAALQPLRARFAQVDERFRERNLRERAILGGGLAALVFFAMDSSLIRPVGDELARKNTAVARSGEEIARLESVRDALERVEKSAEELALLERKALLERQIGEVDRQIAAEISELVSPEAIVAVLENMLEEEPGLTLVRLESQDPHRVGSGSLQDSDEGVLDSTGGLYRHGLRIRLEGDYAATLAYLRRVEASPWHLLWDRLEYHVQKYPKAAITIDLHTISEQEEWIGV